jgi:hypothetical protein
MDVFRAVSDADLFSIEACIAGASLKPVSESGLTSRGFASDYGHHQLAEFIKKAGG